MMHCSSMHSSTREGMEIAHIPKWTQQRRPTSNVKIASEGEGAKEGARTLLGADHNCRQTIAINNKQ
ncbi:unnamed protein product [Ceratitis capitata]|uniref:(Mediterranean fruit fly) hypothetical protein n=1 Tax=Ceratitis capitata TaxID=7213 RepID=A0A811UV35_CERCA|nr:unnamed protein product [Ceratitis capitata]